MDTGQGEGGGENVTFGFGAGGPGGGLYWALLKYGPTIGIGFGASTAIFSSTMIALCIQKVYILHDVIQKMYLGNIYTLIFVLECLDVGCNGPLRSSGPRME